MKTCLIIDDMHPALFPLLEEIGIEANYQPQIKKEEVFEVINRYDGIVVRSKLKLDKAFFAKATKLKYIARAGSGTDNIDVAEAARLGIEILNAPEGNRDAVAEHAIGLLLNLLNKLKIADAEVRNRIWKREANRGVELGHQTVAIIGYGNTGSAFSKRLIGFGCEILAYDINGIDEAELGVEIADLPTIFSKADIVSLHIPLNERNKHIVNKVFIDSFEKPIWLLNTARGELVNTPDLIDALQSRKVLGAGLDVLENEKMETYSLEENVSFDQLAAMPNVLLTPHVAGWTRESYLKISEVLGLKIKHFYEKKES